MNRSRLIIQRVGGGALNRINDGAREEQSEAATAEMSSHNDKRVMKVPRHGLPSIRSLTLHRADDVLTHSLNSDPFHTDEELVRHLDHKYFKLRKFCLASQVPLINLQE